LGVCWFGWVCWVCWGGSGGATDGLGGTAAGCGGARDGCGGAPAVTLGAVGAILPCSAADVVGGAILLSSCVVRIVEYC
jgi:hypothetical protein